MNFKIGDTVRFKRGITPEKKIYYFSTSTISAFQRGLTGTIIDFDHRGLYRIKYSDGTISGFFSSEDFNFLFEANRKIKLLSVRRA